MKTKGLTDIEAFMSIFFTRILGPVILKLITTNASLKTNPDLNFVYQKALTL